MNQRANLLQIQHLGWKERKERQSTSIRIRSLVSQQYQRTTTQSSLSLALSLSYSSSRLLALKSHRDDMELANDIIDSKHPPESTLPVVRRHPTNTTTITDLDSFLTIPMMESSPVTNHYLMHLSNSIMMGIEPTPEIIAIMTIYFVEGALGLARLAQTFLLKDELQLGPAELSALTGVFSLPWTIKPLYGFISDGVPLFGYRRRSYLILCGILGGLSYLALGLDFGGIFENLDSSWTLTATVISLLLSSACVAFCDVVADGIVVQQTRESNDPKVAGGLQSLCWGSAAVGGLLSAYFSGSLLTVMTPRHVFAITAILPFLVTWIAFSTKEEPLRVLDDGSTATNDSGIITQQVQELWDAIRQPSIWKPTLFLFLWQSTPTSDGAFLYFMTDDLHMGPEFLGRVRFVTAVASLVGVWVYQKFLRQVPIKRILLWSSIISTPLGLSSLLLITHTNRMLHIPDELFVFGDDVALAILGQVAFLPTLVLAAKLCPPGIEAVLFATLMSIYNGASTVGTELGAVLTKYLHVTQDNFDNLGLLTILCNVSSLYPLFFIGWLDGVGDEAEMEVEK